MKKFITILALAACSSLALSCDAFLREEFAFECTVDA